jgi:hypothetical protein
METTLGSTVSATRATLPSGRVVVETPPTLPAVVGAGVEELSSVAMTAPAPRPAPRAPASRLVASTTPIPARRPLSALAGAAGGAHGFAGGSGTVVVGAVNGAESAGTLGAVLSGSLGRGTVGCVSVMNP